jgi:hypothetical protein
MSREVFVSYRRADTATAAGEIARALDAALGPRTAFRDVQDLKVGHGWLAQLRDALDRCSVTLLLVGPRFRSLIPGGGRDVVADELRASFRSPRCTVVPVAVGCRPWTDTAGLPEPYRDLPSLHWVTLAHTGSAAMSSLVDAVAAVLAEDAHRVLERRPSLRRLASLTPTRSAALERHVADSDPGTLGLLRLARGDFARASTLLRPGRAGAPEAAFLAGLGGRAVSDTPITRLSPMVAELVRSGSPLAGVLVAAALHDGFESRGLSAPTTLPPGPSARVFAASVPRFRASGPFWEDRGELVWLVESGVLTVSDPVRAALLGQARWPSTVQLSPRRRPAGRRGGPARHQPRRRDHA